MWLLIEDQATSMKWSHFMRRKNELVDVAFNFIRSLKLKDAQMAQFFEWITPVKTFHSKTS